MSGSYDKPGPPRRPGEPHIFAAQPQAPFAPAGQAAPPAHRHAAPQQAPSHPAPPPPPPSHYRQQPYQAHPQTNLQQQPPQTEPFAADYADFYPDEHTAGRAPQGAATPEPDQRELVAHSREETDLELRRTPIVPPGSVTGRSLTLVISIMCFLACLTAGAVYMFNESASAWMRDIATEITVQVEPREKIDTERAVRDVIAFLSRQPGVASAKPLSILDSTALLEPWLGQSTEALSALPMPRLIAVEVDRASPPDFHALRGQLSKQFPAASLDDHQQWQQQIRAMTRSFALGGLAILLLVGAATTAVIVSATRSALASNREIVEVLHYVGATDRFIAREFERHFLRLGVRAGLMGATCAAAVFMALPFAMENLGGSKAAQNEMSRLFGTAFLDLKGYLVLIGLVVVISLLCMLTSRVGVKRILKAQQ